jgi:uncharacterized protein (DUF1800 family)
MPSSDRDIKAAIAATRFGLGAKPGEIASARQDPEGFLRAQIRSSGADQPQANPQSSASRLLELREFQQDRRQGRGALFGMGRQAQDRVPTGAPMVGADRDPVQIAQRMIRRNAGVDFVTRVQLGAATDAAFRERWTLFWANHFTVSAAKGLVTAVLVGPFEQEAIRPNVFGSFEQLLTAATFHPGMLLYLDQAYSIGPGSLGAGFVQARARQQGAAAGGLNENHAREILELHTVGLEAGYSQADVTEFARALTGWSVGGLREGPGRQGRTVYRPIVHEPGERTILGRRYGEVGEGQSREVLHDLARSPFTARHIATKIARHFVSETPPPVLVSRLEASFTNTGGDLSRLAEMLIGSPEAWDPAPRKFKTPYEFLISAWRAAGSGLSDLQSLGPTLTSMGQQPFSAPSPKGWAEEAAQWAAPDAIMRRMAWADAFAEAAVRGRDPMALARDALGARLNQNTAAAIARAESRAEGFAVLLMSPEFQRR